jgi:hypothetical protein
MLLQHANDFVLPKEIVKLQIKCKDPSKKYLQRFQPFGSFFED